MALSTGIAARRTGTSINGWAGVTPAVTAPASDNEAQTRQSAYGLLDYRVELSPEHGDWSIALLGKNLTDETYNVFTSVIPLAPGGAFASVRAKGREVALQMRYRF